jgi:cyclopropane fatty-acyl-phospholipid synthase-like methyltransferase
MSYLEHNKAYWEKGYFAPNVESYVFRLYGRILKPQFGLPKPGDMLLDFGCGQGATVNYMKSVGFDAYGSDISEHDIAIAKERFPYIAEKFSVCDVDPAKARYHKGGLAAVTACQALYYFTKPDFDVAMAKIYDLLRPGGVFFASMMAEDDGEFFPQSHPTDDPWLRRVAFKNKRLKVDDYYMFFVKDDADLRARFSMFKPVFTGNYVMALRQDETTGKHLTFVGVKE